jgi:hypothetical protein
VISVTEPAGSVTKLSSPSSRRSARKEEKKRFRLHSTIETRPSNFAMGSLFARPPSPGLPTRKRLSLPRLPHCLVFKEPRPAFPQSVGSPLRQRHKHPRAFREPAEAEGRLGGEAPLGFPRARRRGLWYGVFKASRRRCSGPASSASLPGIIILSASPAAVKRSFRLSETFFALSGGSEGLPPTARVSYSRLFPVSTPFFRSLLRGGPTIGTPLLYPPARPLSSAFASISANPILVLSGAAVGERIPPRPLPGRGKMPLARVIKDNEGAAAHL